MTYYYYYFYYYYSYTTTTTTTTTTNTRRLSTKSTSQCLSAGKPSPIPNCWDFGIRLTQVKDIHPIPKIKWLVLGVIIIILYLFLPVSY